MAIDYKKKVNVRGKNIKIWPTELEVLEITDCPMTYQVNFTDIDKYHDKLKERVLELEKDENFRHNFEIGGNKIRFVHNWGTAESKLINARASAFFCQAVGRNDAVITSSWASISRKNEYLAGHSHIDCIASLVYMLEPGNGDKEANFLDGRFAITDPRVPGCCDVEEDRVTMEVAPDMIEGSMILFPSQFVHHVHPYTGDEPRITLAWNFKLSEE